MEKNCFLWLAVLSIIFLSYPLLAQDKNNNSNYPINQFTKESSFSQKYGPERYGSECDMDEESAPQYLKGKYGPAGYGTENESY
jgi:hypothetical protein